MMSNIIFISLIILAILFVILTTIFVIKVINRNKLIQELKDTIEIKNEVVRDLQGDLESFKKALSDARDDKDYLTKELNDTINKLNEQLIITNRLQISMHQIDELVIEDQRDLENFRTFQRYWLKLQNEAFKAQALNMTDKKIFLKYVK